jgi:hypothetical protein
MGETNTAFNIHICIKIVSEHGEKKERAIFKW